ncbi:hypothetical protein BST81_25570 [Leptolyngbya sp. 'hensonii']|uniref:hypothetical protein n=1 Tax=Leptolyngbya sp. 'hensonii' TaxID=1922337 RepID=UPI00094F9A4B|nr:hypothetical protein [Leptolyngbya sp. 'hensonii']OLP15580.1 hypothetical protein BST81_25570 [Leptolyngbya sp. 'hensonii']
MLGIFQQSNLRIELTASEAAIADSLTRPAQLRRWLWPQRLAEGLPERLTPGLTYTSWLGPVTIHHRIEQLDSHRLRLLLSHGIDGYHEWSWGEGWVQSRLEGVTVLPLNLGQTLSLLQLRQFLTHRK